MDASPLLTAAVVPGGLYHGSKLGRGGGGWALFPGKETEDSSHHLAGSQSPTSTGQRPRRRALFMVLSSVRPAIYLRSLSLDRSICVSLISLALEAGEKWPSYSLVVI